MTIEFNCSHCGHLVKTPDGAAGKKGKCPACGEILTIPTNSNSSPTKAANSTITFPCPTCSHEVRAPASAVGKKGKCPECAGIFTIPTTSVPTTEKRQAASSQPSPVTGSVEFPCPGCGKQMKTPAAMSGKKGKCPQCGQIVLIPKKSSRPASPGLTAVGDNTDVGLTSLDELTPLGSENLDPFGATANLGGFDPLGGAAGFGTPAANPFGGYAPSLPAPGMNPYATPAPTTNWNTPRKTSSQPSSHLATKICAGLLIGFAVVQLGMSLFVAIDFISHGTAAMERSAAQFRGAGRDINPQAMMIGVCLVIGFGLLVHGVVLAGAIQMMRFRSWGLALTSSILAMLPCNCPICFAGIALGIWGIIMLNMANVKRAF